MLLFLLSLGSARGSADNGGRRLAAATAMARRATALVRAKPAYE